jgi:hypothetical protein
MGFSLYTTCPVTNEVVIIADETEHCMALYHELARRYQVSILDQCIMIGYFLDGIEIEERLREFQRDAALLKLALPIEEALAIWARAAEGLRWLADHSPPERKAEIEMFLAEREERMAAMIAKARAKAKTKPVRKVAHG